MRALTVFLALLLAPVAVLAQPVGAFVQGPAAAPGGYVGPGDIESTISNWAGLRPYSAATVGTKAISLCDPTGINCVDINSDATHGLDYNAVTVTKGCNNSTKICRIQTVYNKVGATDCSDTNNTFQPTLVVDSPTTGLFSSGTPSSSGFPGWACWSGPNTLPFSGYHVSMNITTNGVNTSILTDNGGTCSHFCILYNNGGDTTWEGISNGNTRTIGTLATSTFHAAALITATGASVFNVDGTGGSIADTVAGATGVININPSRNTGASGGWLETGTEAAQWSSTKYCQLQKNAATFYGLSTSGYSC